MAANQRHLLLSGCQHHLNTTLAKGLMSKNIFCTWSFFGLSFSILSVYFIKCCFCFCCQPSNLKNKARSLSQNVISHWDTKNTCPCFHNAVLVGLFVTIFLPLSSFPEKKNTYKISAENVGRQWDKLSKNLQGWFVVLFPRKVKGKRLKIHLKHMQYFIPLFVYDRKLDICHCNRIISFLIYISLKH